MMITSGARAQFEEATRGLDVDWPEELDGIPVNAFGYVNVEQDVWTSPFGVRVLRQSMGAVTVEAAFYGVQDGRSWEFRATWDASRRSWWVRSQTVGGIGSMELVMKIEPAVDVQAEGARFEQAAAELERD